MRNFLKKKNIFSLGSIVFIAGLLGANINTSDLHAQSTEVITPGLSPEEFSSPLGKKIQIVFLNFDAGGIPTFQSVDANGEIITLPDHIYTPDERDEIIREVQKRFLSFNVFFTQEEPSFGEFSTVLLGFNDDRLNRDSTFLGIAETLDFRNLNRSDQAIVDPSSIIISANDTKTVGLGFFGFATGFPVVTTLEDAVSTAVTRLSIQVTSHEVGHILGLRHHDAFGPIGSGIPNQVQFGNILSRAAYKPPYDGPDQADEFIDHLMRAGSTNRENLPIEKFFSERSAIKLTINERLITTPEENVSDEFSVQEISLERLEVPNTLLRGVNANKNLNVTASVVEGSLASRDDLDFYVFSGDEGDIVTIEGISTILRRFSNTNDDLIFRLNLIGITDDGPVILTSNIQDSETFDPQILDYTLPFTGDYAVFIESSNEAFFDGDSARPGQILGFLDERDSDFLRDGKYELLIYTWKEPTEFPTIPK